MSRKIREKRGREGAIRVLERRREKERERERERERVCVCDKSEEKGDRG